ncbi:MAG TPA: flagellar basal-body MS-ring/collar protein FliF [bacterium]|nr:flagellar basal-body MS-ring/collar protein FliF [bacterium]
MGEFFGQLQEQLSRVWGNLNAQQKIMFISAPTVLILALVIAVYVASRPDFVLLVSVPSGEEKRLDEIAASLDASDVKFELRGGNSIYVPRAQRDRVRLTLAGEDLLGAAGGPGLELFDTTRLGMTDRIFEVQYKRGLQNELSRTIRQGARYDSVAVHLSIPEEALFKEDQAFPSASVKIVASRGVSREEVVGIQNLVAAAVPKLEPSAVRVTDKNNKLLSGVSDEVDSSAAMVNKQDQVRLMREKQLEENIAPHIQKIVGPDDYQLSVQMVLDWTEKTEEQNKLDTEGQALISEKTYEEVSNSAAMAGEPGVAGNVQDTGIGAAGGETLKTEIAENIANYDYPTTKINTKHPTGEIKEKHIGIILNYHRDPESGDMVPYDDAIIEDLRQTIASVAGIKLENAESADTLSIKSMQFDTRKESERRREYWLEQGQKLIRSALPVIALAVLAVLGFLFFQKAFAPKVIEEEEVEEVPIEPVTESRELTLAQLGLAQFGDIASLPAEEQRRLKMQEHVISYAQEKPEEVAAIIKAWLSG